MTHGITSKNSGLCPHGFPGGACPLCSGMGGGRSASTRNMRRNPGEMTYNECYAIWQMMKAAKLKHDKLEKLQAEQNANNNIQNINSGKFNIINFMNKLIKIPTINSVINATSNIFATLKNNITKTFSNIANFAIEGFNKIVNGIKNFTLDISDKIAAIFGEMKLAINENIQKAIKSLREKIISLFGFINKSKEEEETDQKVKQEEKRIFSLRMIKEKLKLLKEENKNADKQHSPQQ